MGASYSLKLGCRCTHSLDAGRDNHMNHRPRRTPPLVVYIQNVQGYLPVRSNNPYDDSQIIPRRDHDNMAPNFPLRYPPHSAGTREGALQHLHWHSRDTPDRGRDPRRCNPQSTSTSYSSSPMLPFSSQGYHNTPTYTSSWTSTDSNLMTMPTLHSIAQSPVSYDGSYSSDSASDKFTNVDGFRDSYCTLGSAENLPYHKASRISRRSINIKGFQRDVLQRRLLGHR